MRPERGVPIALILGPLPMPLPANALGLPSWCEFLLRLTAWLAGFLAVALPPSLTA